MKALILHLSDMHYEKRGDISKENVNGILKAIKTVDAFSFVIIVVSGDIAYSGKIKEYNIAYNFFELLKNKIKQEFGTEDIYFCIVPGNHDVDYNKGHLTHHDLEVIYKEQKQDESLSDEFEKMNAFYNHANGLDCFSDKKSLVCVRKITLSDKNIRFNLINTAAYSSKEEEQGMHYLPQIDLDKLENGEKSDYIITVMHHPHHWFNSLMKKELEKKIYEKSDLIFVGHEHYSSSMDIGVNNSQVKIYAGGELANQGDWSNSEFYIGLLELDTREYAVIGFRWDVKSKLYVRQKKERVILSKNRINQYNFEPTKEYMMDLLQDKKYMIAPSFTDYYVFPRLEEEVINEKRWSKEPSQMDDFLKEVYNCKRVVIMGRSDSGKSVLLKSLFKKMIETKIALYIYAYDVRESYEQTIACVFEKCYSNQGVEYERFRQAPQEDKILILDDADTLEERLLENFLLKAEKEFDIVIYSCEKIVELDIKERIKRGTLEKQYKRYQIQAFYADKRKELVTNVVKLVVKQDEQAQENIIQLLCEALSKQRNLFRMDPDFIVQFTKYYCNNIGETIQNDGEIFSKVFEANIVSMLKPFAKDISVDKILIVMDKIAYGMHCNKKYPINQNDICEIINKYNEEFDSEINYAEFLDILINSKIFAKNKTDYYFAEKSYLAYFVAREIKRRCIEEQDYAEFNKALEYACYGINMDILLFVTYITDNLNLIRLLMEKADKYTSDWEEFSVNPIRIPYLSDVEQLKVKIVDTEDKERAEEEEIQRERKLEEVKEDEVVYREIYSYNEEIELSLMKKMIRALSLLIIISRTLPSFEHMMKRQDKEKCVHLIYSLPLKIFNIWALEVEGAKLELVDEIKNLYEWEYRKEKIEMSDTDVLNYLRWESISLLMEIMNASIGNATKSNTYKFLDSFKYKNSALYGIEHLMGLDKRDYVTEFIKEAEELYIMQKRQLPKLMIQRVARHFMIRSKKIQRENIQRLNAKLWKGKLNQSVLLLDKNRIEKKEQ